MSYRIFNFTITVLLLVSIFSSCSKNTSNIEEMRFLKNPSELFGKWKLSETVSSGFITQPKTENYSQYNIVFEFKPNGILTVSGNLDSHWPNNGDHDYSVVEPDTQHGPNLKISTLYFWTRSNSKELEIDSRPVDGGVFKLLRIK